MKKHTKHSQKSCIIFYQKFNVLSCNQYDFNKNESTETVLCSYIISAVDALDQLLTPGLFVNSSRGFDCVQHSLCLEKLHRYGVRDRYSI